MEHYEPYEQAGTMTRPRIDAGEKKLFDVKYKVFLEQCFNLRHKNALG